MVDKLVENLSNEISLMSSLDHPNLIKTLQTCTSGHKIYIIMPLMSGGSLSSIISYKYPSGIKDESVIATIMKVCLETLDYLHQRSYMHRDIKSGNILLNMEGFITLADFGVATKIKNESKKKSFVGTLNWMPPEVISNEGYDFKFDIWSLGITAIEIAQGKAPFFNLGELEIIKKVQYDDPPSLKDPSKWDPLFIDFIKSCLVKDPLQRPTAKELLIKNKAWFDLKAKDYDYLKKNLLQGVSSVIDRYKNIKFTFEDSKNKEEDSFNGDQYRSFKKISWDFSCLENYKKTEDCEVTDNEEITIKIDKFDNVYTNDLENLNLNKKQSSLKKNSISNKTVNEIQTNKDATSNSSFKKTITFNDSFKVKMNPDIEQTLKRHSTNKITDKKTNSKISKEERFKKCFDDDGEF